MKRSCCLSTLLVGLVGLSLTASSVAFAQEGGVGVPDPSPAPSPAPTEEPVAPAAPAQPDATPPKAPEEPAATPPESPITAGTNVVVGVEQPKDAVQEDPKATASPKPRPFAGSSLFTQTSVSTATLFRGQQQDYNPTVESSIWLTPRYAINEAFQVRGRLIFTYEWTNSDTTVTKNEPRFSDTSLQLFYRKIPEIPKVGIKPMVALNVALPTSPESRARTLYFSPGATLQLSKAVEHVLGGEVMIVASTAYSHPVYSSQNAEVRGHTPYAFQCLGGTTCQDLLGGGMNVSDSLVYSVFVVGEWGKWSPGLAFLGGSQWAYRPKDVEFQGRPVERNLNPTNVRQTTYFSGWLDYNVNSWFTGEVGYQFSRTVLNEDGTYGNPFFDRHQDMRVYLGASFQLDNIAKLISGQKDAEGGIVRATNERKPFGNL